MKKINSLFFAAAMVVCMPSVASLPGFDFSYEIGGDRKIAPLQIFDDGSRTYIQWPTALVLPSISVTIDGKKLNPIAGATPYYVVNGVGSGIEIRSDRSVSRATYVGERGKAPMHAAQTAQPVIAAERATRAAAQRGAEIQQWEIAETDRTLDVTLTRWAKASGYTLQWRIADSIVIDRGASYTGPLSTVLAKVAREVSVSIQVDGTVITVSETE